jgi:hypothetical protein
VITVCSKKRLFQKNRDLFIVPFYNLHMLRYVQIIFALITAQCALFDTDMYFKLVIALLPRCNGIPKFQLVEDPQKNGSAVLLVGQDAANKWCTVCRCLPL